MSRYVAVKSPIMPDHTIDVEDITRVEWDTFCRPAVRLEFGNGNWDIITRVSAEALVKMEVIPTP